MELRNSAISEGNVTFLDPDDTDEVDVSWGVAVVLSGEMTNADIIDEVN